MTAAAAPASTIRPFPEPVEGFGDTFVKQYHDYARNRAAIVRTCGGSAYVVLDVLREYSHGYGQAVTRWALSAREVAEASGLTVNTAETALRNLQSVHMVASNAEHVGRTTKRTWRLLPPGEWTLDEPAEAAAPAETPADSTTPNFAQTEQGETAHDTTTPNFGEVSSKIGVVEGGTTAEFGVVHSIERKQRGKKPAKETRTPARTRDAAGSSSASRPSSRSVAARSTTRPADVPDEWQPILAVLYRVPGWRPDAEGEYMALDEFCGLSVGGVGQAYPPAFVRSRASDYRTWLLRKTETDSRAPRADIGGFRKFMANTTTAELAKWQAQQSQTRGTTATAQAVAQHGSVAVAEARRAADEAVIAELAALRQRSSETAKPRTHATRTNDTATAVTAVTGGTLQ